MGAASFLVSSLLGGEWSQAAQGAITDPRYKTAMNVSLNGYPVEASAWTRRSGFKYAQTTRGGAAGRVIPFQRHDAQPYNMEFTDGYLRFFSGLTLVTTNDDQTVLAVSSANPAVVQTSAAHGWSTGNSGYFSGLGTNNPLLQNRVFKITVTDSTHFSLQDAITGANIDGSTLGTFVSGTFKRVHEVTTVYGPGLWQNVRSVQAEDSSVLLHPTIPPQLLSITDSRAGGFGSFSITNLVFQDGPYADPVTGGATVTPSALTGNITLTIGFPTYDSTKVYSKGDFAAFSGNNYQSRVDANLNNQPDTHPTQWLAVSAGIAVGPNGFQGSDVGRMIRIFSEPPDWATATNYSAGNVVKFNNSYWTALTTMTGATPTTGNINPNQPGNLTTTWAANPSAAIWTWGKITGLGNQISQSLAGVANIGDMTVSGGLAAAFDGNTAQTLSASAEATAVVTPLNFLTSYVGRNFSGTVATAYAISQVTVFPSTDNGFYSGGQVADKVTISLYAKQTAPSSFNDGTLLGTTGAISNTTSAVTITSSDQVTTWKYIWVAYVRQNTSGNNQTLQQMCCELQFFGPTGSGSSNTAVTFEVLGSALKYTTAIRTWRLGIYSDTTGYPSCGTYHEGRIWLSGSVNNRIDASAPNSLVNGNVSFAPTASDGTVTSANGISYVFNSPGANKIFHMTPDLQGIVCGTDGGEWLIQPTALNEAITPTNIKAHRMTRIRCANIEPRHAEHTTLIVQKFQRKVVEYFADIYSGKFSAPNLNLYSKHITVSGIQEIAYQQELTPILWARLGNGSLIGMTYKRETLTTSQGPAFFAWHRHTLGSGRTVESLAVGPSVGATTDSLTVVTNDAATGIRHVEVLGDQFDETDVITTACFLDDAVAASSYSTGTITGGVQGVTINGLWHLNGKTVTVFAGGLDVGDYTVSSGSVQVPFAPGSQTNTLFTSSFVSAFSGAMPIYVGFTYTSDGQLVSPDTNPESGARNGPGFGKVRRLHKFAASLVNTQGIYFGTDFAKLNKATLKTDGGTPLAANVLFSGVHKDTIRDGNEDYTGRLTWRITRPFPAIIAGIGGFLQTQDE